MNCPSCHCPRGEPLTVATNSLVTRCQHAFHAVAVARDANLVDPQCPSRFSGNVCHRLNGHEGDHRNIVTGVSWRPFLAPPEASPARPDDFATETAKGTTPPHPTHHGAAEALVCLVCGKAECSHGEAKVVVCAGCGSSDGGHPLDCPTRVEFPYTTPVPSPTANGANGFRWCHSCQSVAEVAGHECAPAVLVINGSCSPEELAALKGEIGGVIVAAPSDMGWEISEGRRERAEFAESLLCATVFGHGLAYGTCRCDFCNIIRDAARGGGR